MLKKIVIVGSSNVDLIVKGDKIPKQGETVIGGTFYKATGGKCANQAAAVSVTRMGAQPSAPKREKIEDMILQAPI